MMRFLATLLLLPTFVQAQGRVEYTVVTTLNVELPPDMEAFRDQIPTETTARRELVFDDAAALTRPAETPVAKPGEAPTEADRPHGPSVRVTVLGAGHGASHGEDETYLDRATGEMVRTRDLLGRTFRVTGAAPALRWRLTGEQSTFLGYACQRAVAERDGRTVEAWFAPELAEALGPDAYGGLPGLILVLRDGHVSYEATAVALGPLADGAPPPPSEGQEVTSEAFETLQAERLRDLETMGGPGGGSVRILRR